MLPFSFFAEHWARFFGLPVSIQEVINGEVHVTMVPTDPFQDTAGQPAVSAITAMNAARCVLELEKAGTRGWLLLDAMMNSAFVECLLQFTADWTGSPKLGIDEIYKAPIFHRPLRISGHRVHGTSVAELRGSIKEIQQLSPHASTATLFTGSLGAVVVFNIKTNVLSCPEMIVLFDTRHRAPDDAEGPAFLFFPSIDSATKHLYWLFNQATQDDDDEEASLITSHTFSARPGFQADETLAAAFDANRSFLAVTSQYNELHRSLVASEQRTLDLLTQMDVAETSARVCRESEAAWKAELEIVREKMAAMEAAKESAESQIEDIRASAASETRLLTQEVAELKSRVSALQTKHAATEREKQATLSKAEVTRASHASEIAQLRAQLLAAQASRTALEQEKKAALANSAKEAAEFERQRAQLQQRLDQSSLIIQNFQRDAVRTGQELAALKAAAARTGELGTTSTAPRDLTFVGSASRWLGF